MASHDEEIVVPLPVFSTLAASMSLDIPLPPEPTTAVRVPSEPMLDAPPAPTKTAPLRSNHARTSTIFSPLLSDSELDS